LAHEQEEHVTDLHLRRPGMTAAKCRRVLAIMSCAAGLIPSMLRAQAVPAADGPPSALLELGQSGKFLFDAAYASDWRSASEQMRAVNDAVSRLPLDLPKPDIVSHLKAAVQYAGDGTNAHDRIETMDEANSITRLAADLSASFQPLVPYEATMLGYYGRQLELGLVAARPALLAQSVDALQSTWSRLEPTLERRGYADEAKHFTDIVVQLVGAQRPAQFVAPTRAELTEAERIESLLARPSR
jgi:hypothetical protein